ncbi:MAG: hypothetical protein ACK5S5_18925 [Planctomycetota bacterium]|jgi:hypothetical protein
MRHPYLCAFLAFATLVAACSSVAEQPAVAAQPAAPIAPVAAVPAATPTPATATTTAAPKSLKSAMQGIEDDWKQIEQGLAAATADLPAMAKAAERVAAVMKLGYDPFEDKEVPNFAQLAREAEAAFLDLAKKAAAGDAAGVKAMAKTLQPQHCARCHDAYEEVHG